MRRNRYAEAADLLSTLPSAVRAAREETGLSLRDVAAQSGVSFSTVNRVEQGVDVRAAAAERLLRWVGSL